MAYNEPKSIENPEPLNLRTFEILTVFGVIVSVLLPLFYWSILPDRMPIHFDLAGHPDGWGGKASVLMLPGVTIFIFLLMKLCFYLIRKHRGITNVRNFNTQQLRITFKMLAWLNLALVWMFTLLLYQSIQVAVGKTEGLGVWSLPVFLIVTFGIVIVFLIKLAKARKAN